MLPTVDADRFAIRQLVENWALWRDAGDWERFATVWHPTEGWMTATWFQGPARDFIAASRQGFDAGVSKRLIVEIRYARTAGLDPHRARIRQHPVYAGGDRVACMGRFYDFCARHQGQWKIVRRQPIYEKDRLDVVDPAGTLTLDPALLAQFPVGYRHLGYLQTRAGFTVKTGLPGLTGEAVLRLYDEGARWLDGSPSPGEPR